MSESSNEPAIEEASVISTIRRSLKSFAGNFVVVSAAVTLLIGFSATVMEAGYLGAFDPQLFVFISYSDVFAFAFSKMAFLAFLLLMLYGLTTHEIILHRRVAKSYFHARRTGERVYLTQLLSGISGQTGLAACWIVSISVIVWRSYLNSFEEARALAWIFLSPVGTALIFFGLGWRTRGISRVTIFVVTYILGMYELGSSIGAFSKRFGDRTNDIRAKKQTIEDVHLVANLTRGTVLYDGKSGAVFIIPDSEIERITVKRGLAPSDGEFEDSD
jgi:hypothetical protein